MNFAITQANLSPEVLSKVDPRILKYIKGWKINEQYSGQNVPLPDYVPFNYFEALNKPEGIDEDEKQLTLWCGWAGRSNGKDIDGLYDAEVIITIAVNGKACHDQTVQQVNIELLKSGGAPIQVYYNDKLVTDFMDTITIPGNGWLSKPKSIKVNNGYQAIRDFDKFLSVTKTATQV